MKNRNLHSLALSLCLVLGWQAAPALGQFVSGSDGTDGPLNVTTNTVINLALAATGPWDTTPHTAGVGVYDPAQWAVVFHYTTINVDPLVTVTFKNHPKGAPVIWLATGDVTIAGQVRLDGAIGTADFSASFPIPGPGGFSGGILGFGASDGFGPGGSFVVSGTSGGGGYGSVGGGFGGGVIYGTASLVPLIGGSGAGSFNSAGGAGGGAILIASSGNISLPDPTGGIFAIGGSVVASSTGGGSGGGIRLIANDISGSGLLRATGGVSSPAGGKGRIRVEAINNLLVDPGDPLINTGLPGSVFPPSTTPTLRVTSVTVAPGIDKPVPADPLATVLSPDVCFTSSGPVTLNIEANNVPVGQFVTVRIVRARTRVSQVVTSTTALAGTLALSTTTADVTFFDGTSEVQLSVSVP